jgi:hypothetical protein
MHVPMITSSTLGSGSRRGAVTSSNSVQVPCHTTQWHHTVPVPCSPADMVTPCLAASQARQTARSASLPGHGMCAASGAMQVQLTSCRPGQAAAHWHAMDRPSPHLASSSSWEQSKLVLEWDVQIHMLNSSPSWLSQCKVVQWACARSYDSSWVKAKACLWR